MTTGTAFPPMTSTMTFDEALEAVIRYRKLTPGICDALGLNRRAVNNWENLPSDTQHSMLEALIDRLDK